MIKIRKGEKIKIKEDVLGEDGFPRRMVVEYKVEKIYPTYVLLVRDAIRNKGVKLRTCFLKRDLGKLIVKENVK